jgi:hypothetical protein
MRRLRRRTRPDVRTDLGQDCTVRSDHDIGAQGRTGKKKETMSVWDRLELLLPKPAPNPKRRSRRSFLKLGTAVRIVSGRSRGLEGIVDSRPIVKQDEVGYKVKVSGSQFVMPFFFRRHELEEI